MITENQTIYDLVNQHYGGIEGLLGFIEDNPTVVVSAFDGTPSVEITVNETSVLSKAKREAIQKKLNGRNIETLTPFP